MRYFSYVVLSVLLPFSATSQVSWVSTTNDQPWLQQEVKLAKTSKIITDVTVLTNEPEQVIDGFGVCFNELGWTVLSILREQECEGILKNLPYI